jgi:hypothetical protein
MRTVCSQSAPPKARHNPSFKQSPNGLAPGTRGSDGYHLPHGPGTTLSVAA